MEKNMERAREYCRRVYECGYTPLAPSIYFTQFLNDDYPNERAVGIEMGAALLPLCRVLVVCGDKITEGMRLEIERARELGIEICALETVPVREPTADDAAKSSVLRQIAGARDQPLSSGTPKPGRGRPRNPHGEEH